jgi:hypothetical protein
MAFPVNRLPNEFALMMHVHQASFHPLDFNIQPALTDIRVLRRHLHSQRHCERRYIRQF